MWEASNAPVLKLDLVGSIMGISGTELCHILLFHLRNGLHVLCKIIVVFIVRVSKPVRVRVLCLLILSIPILFCYVMFLGHPD